MYTLHAGSNTYRGTETELEAIRMALKQESYQHWAHGARCIQTHRGSRLLLHPQIAHETYLPRRP